MSGTPVTRLLIAYDGGGFAGWARQPGLRTVQGELETAIATLRGGQPVTLTVAGRTDRGVHGVGQVASYAGDPVPLTGLNALLPHDVAVRGCERAPDGFDARRWATSRVYRYRVARGRVRDPFETGRALLWPKRCSFERLAECARLVVGRHDFTAFTPTETEHVRFERDVLQAHWSREGELWCFDVEADAFMRSMVRVLVGTMLEVAGERRTVADFARLLRGAPRSRAGPTAPPHGLYFMRACYDPVTARSACQGSAGAHD